jgi:beta-1,4-mannosyl-glycoprotein beta-1,4-N-acetylglucosaminyltransferase
MVYDCFSFFNELDLLEIRLNILDKYVDYFVLGESYQTFSGKQKLLFYQENKERFAKWNHKIIHIIHPIIPFIDSFQIAGYQKDNLKSVLINLNDDDIVYFGDTDEIWKPKEITDDKVYNLKQINYSYYLNNRSSEQWVGTIVSKYKNIKNGSFNEFRAKHINELNDGGWHFTNMGGLDQIIKKLESYDHQEFNNDYIKSQLKNRIENGQDYVGRYYDWLGNPFTFKIDEQDLPKFLIENKQKYIHLFK